MFDFFIKELACDVEALAHAFLTPELCGGSVNEFFRGAYLDLRKRCLAAFAAFIH